MMGAGNEFQSETYNNINCFVVLRSALCHRRTSSAAGDGAELGAMLS